MLTPLPLACRDAGTSTCLLLLLGFLPTMPTWRPPNWASPSPFLAPLLQAHWVLPHGSRELCPALHTSLLLSEAIPAALVLHHRPDILSPLLFLCTEERQPEVPFALKEDQLCLGCAAPPQAPAQQTPVRRAVLYLTSQLG